MNFIFNGPPGSGKDEACHFLKVNYGYAHLEFKQELFRATAQYYDVSLDWFMENYNDRIIKERGEHRLDGFSRREAMIFVSEEIIKPRHGKDYFGVKTSEKVDPSRNYCFSDGGFVEEITPVINRVGHDKVCIVQIYRTGCSFSSDSRNYINGILIEELGTKDSESSIQKSEPQIPIRMYRIYNNTSVSDFHQMIRKILGKEANANSKVANLR